LNLECCKCARMRFYCANCLVVQLRICAPQRELCHQAVASLTSSLSRCWKNDRCAKFTELFLLRGDRGALAWVVANNLLAFAIKAWWITEIHEAGFQLIRLVISQHFTLSYCYRKTGTLPFRTTFQETCFFTTKCPSCSASFTCLYLLVRWQTLIFIKILHNAVDAFSMTRAHIHRCRSRQNFAGGAKDFRPNFLKLAQKVFVRVLPTNCLLRRSWRPFFGMTSESKKGLDVFFCKRWAQFFKIKKRWAPFLPGFSTNQNFWGCACTPASFTTCHISLLESSNKFTMGVMKSQTFPVTH